MKFFTILALASFAIAAPLTERDATAIGTVTDAVDTLQDSASGDIDTVEKAVQSVKDSTDASLIAKVEGTVNANYKAIVQALQDAGDAIVKSTTGASGGIAGSLQGLTQQNINRLTKDVNTIKDILTSLGATFKLTATNLTPEAQAAVKTETDAVKAAIRPFIAPLTVLVTAAEKASATAQLTVTGLKKAQSGLNSVVDDLVGSVGAPSVSALTGKVGK